MNVPPFITDAEIDAIQRTDEHASMLPPRCYSSPEAYAYEVEHVLKRNWLLVGRWDQVENPGDFFSIDLFGEPLVIVKDHENKLHALSRTCRHRWMTVVEGKGNQKIFTCPYHRWTYELNGKLRGVTVSPIDESLKKDCRLPEYRLECWGGYIFINFDEDAEPLAPQIQPVAELMEPYGLDEWRLVYIEEYVGDWNWKLSVDNAWDAIHTVGIHYDTLMKLRNPDQQYTDFGSSITIDTNGSPCLGIWNPGMPDQPSEHNIFGRPPFLNDEQYARGGFVGGIFPSLAFVTFGDYMVYLKTEFNEVDNNPMEMGICVAPYCRKLDDYEEKVKLLIDMNLMVNADDKRACRYTHKGLCSERVQMAILHPAEKSALQIFHQWLLEQYLSGMKSEG